MRYVGREFTEEEVQWLKDTISGKADLGRSALSRQFCEVFNWRKPDGGLKEMSCRVAFLKMEKDGLISLPPCKFKPHKTRLFTQRSFLTLPRNDITLRTGELNLSFEIVGKEWSFLWNEYIDRYHYLGYTPLSGAQLRYFVRSGSEILALLGFGAAAWTVAPRDTFIGWDSETRKKNLHLIVNNSRFLKLPWIHGKNLCSKILSLAAKRLASDWEKRYNYRPVLLETFVEKERFSGACYKASNWIYVGDTKGRGKLDVKNEYKLPVKSIHLYPLSRKFREKLCEGRA